MRLFRSVDDLDDGREREIRIGYGAGGVGGNHVPL